MEPEVLTDYEGMEGTSVYTEESGMLTYEVDMRRKACMSLVFPTIR